MNKHLWFFTIAVLNKIYYIKYFCSAVNVCFQLNFYCKIIFIPYLVFISKLKEMFKIIPLQKTDNIKKTQLIIMNSQNTPKLTVKENNAKVVIFNKGLDSVCINYPY